jgi:hypothetical protein
MPRSLEIVGRRALSAYTYLHSTLKRNASNLVSDGITAEI